MKRDKVDLYFFYWILFCFDLFPFSCCGETETKLRSLQIHGGAGMRQLRYLALSSCVGKLKFLHVFKLRNFIVVRGRFGRRWVAAGRELFRTSHFAETSPSRNNKYGNSNTSEGSVLCCPIHFRIKNYDKRGS